VIWCAIWSVSGEEEGEDDGSPEVEVSIVALIDEEISWGGEWVGLVIAKAGIIYAFAGPHDPGWTGRGVARSSGRPMVSLSFRLRSWGAPRDWGGPTLHLDLDQWQVFRRVHRHRRARGANLQGYT
jgi:hypothetical protein